MIHAPVWKTAGSALAGFRERKPGAAVQHHDPVAVGLVIDQAGTDKEFIGVNLSHPCLQEPAGGLFVDGHDSLHGAHILDRFVHSQTDLAGLLAHEDAQVRIVAPTVRILDADIVEELSRLLGRQHVRSPRLDLRPVRLGGELSAVEVGEVIEKVTGVETSIPYGEPEAAEDAPELPVRPPVLCAGCPHRGAFYAVKKAVGKRPAIYGGDIGCYTLGNAAPLDMVDTCLCMGAGITMAQGLDHAMRGQDDKPTCFAFVGDSTFFASGITGTVNAVYNQSDMILCVLDNSTTAMTGHQPHPGMGVTMMGEKVEPVDIGRVLEGIGVKSIRTVDPQNLEESMQAVSEAMEEEGVRAIIFKSPCVALVGPGEPLRVDSERCVGCMMCINEIGCTALIPDSGNLTEKGRPKAMIDKALCAGCGLCAQVCPADAIVK